MAKKLLKFPDNFLWGAATSAHQVEGGLHNNWTVWEKSHAERLAAGSQKAYDTPSVHWRKIKGEAQDPANYISGAACDHYHRYKEDFDIAQDLGHNVHRFSIEWSRIEPRQGEFDKDEIEHYRRVVKALKKRGLEPFVTLFHWTTPVWVSEQGDWYSGKTARDFLNFVEYVVTNLKEEVKFWTVYNEPEIFTQMSYFEGFWPPGGRNLLQALVVYHRLIRTYKKAYQLIKEISPDAQVGVTVNNGFIEAQDKSSFSRLTAAFARWWANHYFLWRTRRRFDFIGLNYYFHIYIKGLKVILSSRDPQDMGWGMYPRGIYNSLMELKKYQRPVYITECGVADREDVYRGWYIREVLKAVHRAIRDGIVVRGFMYWSLLDNFEWDKGFWPRFGLVEVDYKHGRKRSVRASAKTYAQIIKAGGVEE